MSRTRKPAKKQPAPPPQTDEPNPPRPRLGREKPGPTEENYLDEAGEREEEE